MNLSIYFLSKWMSIMTSLRMNNYLWADMTKSVLSCNPQFVKIFTKIPQGMVHLVLIISITLLNLDKVVLSYSWNVDLDPIMKFQSVIDLKTFPSKIPRSIIISHMEENTCFQSTLPSQLLKSSCMVSCSNQVLTCVKFLVKSLKCAKWPMVKHFISFLSHLWWCYHIYCSWATMMQ